MQTIRLSEVPHGSPLYRRAVELRDALLRRPLGLAFSPDELAAEAGSHHLVALEGDDLVACLVLRPLGGDDGRAAIQMRQVAVAPEHQRGGVGTALVTFAEAFAAARGYRQMVLHARDGAAPFYERLNYLRVGEPFLEVNLPHIQMHKDLSAER